MKALEILKAIEEQEGTHLWLSDGSGYHEDYITEAIEQLEKHIKDTYTLKLLFDSEFCRCSKCGEYKRSGFGCYCEND